MFQESTFKADWNTSQHHQQIDDRYCKSENPNEVSDLFSTKVSRFPASRAELIRAIQSSPFDVLETTGNARYDRGIISDHDFPRKHQMMVDILKGMI